MLELSVRIMDDSYTVQHFHGIKTQCARAASKNHGWLIPCNSFMGQTLSVLEPSAVRITDNSYTAQLFHGPKIPCASMHHWCICNPPSGIHKAHGVEHNNRGRLTNNTKVWMAQWPTLPSHLMLGESQGFSSGRLTDNIHAVRTFWRPQSPWSRAQSLQSCRSPAPS